MVTIKTNAMPFERTVYQTVDTKTYKISSSTKPRKACSSKHVISLLSICKLRSDVAPLNVFLPIIANELCDKSLYKHQIESVNE